MMNDYELKGSKELHQFDGSNFNPHNTPVNLLSNSDEPIDFTLFQTDTDVNFISRILLEEDTEDKIYMLEGDPALVAAVEKPFYDILNGGDQGTGSAVSPDGPPLYTEIYTSPEDRGSADSSSAADVNCLADYIGSMDHHISQFNKGVEEANKFLPNSSKFLIDVASSGPSAPLDLTETRRLKNRHGEDDLGLEGGRRTKQSATSSGEEIAKKDFDEVVLCSVGPKCEAVTSANNNSPSPSSSSSSPSPSSSSSAASSSSSKGRKSKQTKKEVVDLRSLLILCAQSISTDDRLSAKQQLKQIRQHASSTGDGSQRLGHYLAEGLEARLAGMGSEIYRSQISKRRTSVAEILRAYRMYMKACPFKKIANAFANQTILASTGNSSRIHIVNFGISLGFQWPCLIQALSSRSSGVSKLRITGIDLPQPGFRPSERLEETGRRLSDYASEFKVPFEYNHIASKFENVRAEDVDIRDDEVLVVVCTHVMKNIADETIALESPRDAVLKNIRRMNPFIFIHGVVNGAYGSPFFVTRFREVLFHFSALFDALDTNVDREDLDREFVEREFLGQEVLNAIACEGPERVHRPETYKQWQARHQRCGFQQLPIAPEALQFCKDMILPLYHSDYIIDVDGKWLLEGWKGRVLFAISKWKPSR